MLCFEMKHSSRSIGMSRESMELCELAEEQGKLDKVSQNDLSSRSSLVVFLSSPSRGKNPGMVLRSL